MNEVLKNKHTLYICYFGLREPLVQTQVIPYLQELAGSAMKVSLLTFEPDLAATWDVESIETARREMAEKGIEWSVRAYHKRPSAVATAYDIVTGALAVRKRISRDKIDILHGRVHVATLMGAIARKFSSRKPKLIFDIRGFFPEEYTDAGVWPEDGILFRSAKRVESWLLEVSDGFVVLTEKAREVLFPGSLETGRDSRGRPVQVIPCCVDFRRRFAAPGVAEGSTVRQKLSIGDRYVITHVGALIGLYMAKEIADFLAAARTVRGDVFALFLTQSDPAEMTRLLSERGFTNSDFYIAKVPAAEIPNYMEASDAGLSFVKASYATLSRSPTKIPEYLAGGLPLVANAGVGDVDELIQSEGVGVLLREFSETGYREAFERLLELGDISEKCRSVARERFDLASVGGVKYVRLYEDLFCNREG